MTKIDHPTVEIRVGADAIDRFTAFLQAGVALEAPGNISIGAFLARLPGFTMYYIRERVQTIFLNGSATDDLDTSLAGSTPVLALSAALPGLAGAIFRRGGGLAVLRSDCVRPQAPTDQPQTMTVTLKLFNMIAAEKGAGILARGVGATGSGLSRFLHDRPDAVASITQAHVAGQAVEPQQLTAQTALLDTITLIIRTDDGQA